MKDVKMLIRDWNKHQCLMLFLCLFFLSAGISQVVHATSNVAMGIDQNLRITGVVKDTNGEPMIGKGLVPVLSQTLTVITVYLYLEVRVY